MNENNQPIPFSDHLTLTLDIEKQDIDGAERKCHWHCPVARRLIRLLKQMGYSDPQVYVDNNVILFWPGDGHSYTGYPPREAKQWIRRYDRKAGDRPFEFAMSFMQGGDYRQEMRQP